MIRSPTDYMAEFGSAHRQGPSAVKNKQRAEQEPRSARGRTVNKRLQLA